MAERADERRQALEDIGVLLDQGWYWSNTTQGMLLCPGDPDAHLWYDSATGELTYSSKVVEMMARLLREDEEGP